MYHSSEESTGNQPFVPKCILAKCDKCYLKTHFFYQTKCNVEPKYITLSKMLHPVRRNCFQFSACTRFTFDWFGQFRDVLFTTIVPPRWHWGLGFGPLYVPELKSRVSLLCNNKFKAILSYRTRKTCLLFPHSRQLHCRPVWTKYKQLLLHKISHYPLKLVSSIMVLNLDETRSFAVLCFMANTCVRFNYPIQTNW